MARNMTYDPQLESDQFWSDLRTMFNQWQDEDMVNERFEIEGETYKIRLWNDESIHGKDKMIFEITLRTPNGNQ
jgi:hypothetical protein